VHGTFRAAVIIEEKCQTGAFAHSFDICLKVVTSNRGRKSNLNCRQYALNMFMFFLLQSPALKNSTTIRTRTQVGEKALALSTTRLGPHRE
jgi:hypothetical protein